MRIPLLISVPIIALLALFRDTENVQSLSRLAVSFANLGWSVVMLFVTLDRALNPLNLGWLAVRALHPFGI